MRDRSQAMVPFGPSARAHLMALRERRRTTERVSLKEQIRRLDGRLVELQFSIAFQDSDDFCRARHRWEGITSIPETREGQLEVLKRILPLDGEFRDRHGARCKALVSILEARLELQFATSEAQLGNQLVEPLGKVWPSLLADTRSWVESTLANIKVVGVLPTPRWQHPGSRAELMRVMHGFAARLNADALTPTPAGDELQVCEKSGAFEGDTLDRLVLDTEHARMIRRAVWKSHETHSLVELVGTMLDEAGLGADVVSLGDKALRLAERMGDHLKHVVLSEEEFVTWEGARLEASTAFELSQIPGVTLT